jgi:anti-sigma factor RsiW
MKCEEAGELVTALVDNQLSALERAAIEAHLKNCASCELFYRQQLALKSEIRGAVADLKAPVTLRKKILNDRGIHPRQPVVENRPAWRVIFSLRSALAVALLVLLALPVLYVMKTDREPVSLSALEIHQRILRGEVSVIKAGSAEEIKDSLYRSVAGSFAPMTYDLSKIHLKPVAGTVQEVNGRKLLVIIYKGEAATVTCYTLLGTETDAPPMADRFYDTKEKINFYAYSRDGINAVMHREGNLICILASTMPTSELLALARFTT